MKVYRTYRELPENSRGSVVAIGNFDGVHRGHKALIEAALHQANNLGTRLGIITFEPHPLQILLPEKAPRRLTPFRTKVQVLAEHGVERLFALTFNKEMRQKSPETFVHDVLVDGLAARHIVVGYDFRFGHKARGDVSLLTELGRQHRFGVTKVEPVSWRGQVCSSSLIRTAIAEGDMALAADLLGHPFLIEGRVVEGAKRGRELGFPTANIRPPADQAPRGPVLWPSAGIYAVRVAWHEQGHRIWADGAASLGFRPTFDDHQGLLLEIHLLDRSDNLYGKRLCCQFISRLRGEEKFDDISALKSQMEKDCDDVRAILAKSP